MRKSDSTTSVKRGAAHMSAKSSATRGPVKGGAAHHAPHSQRPQAASPGTRIDIPVLSREHMVAEAAYYRAERRGFTPGGELQDWLDAVDEIEQLLNH